VLYCKVPQDDGNSPYLMCTVPMTHQGCGFLPFNVGLNFMRGPSRDVNGCYTDTLGLNSCLW